MTPAEPDTMKTAMVHAQHITTLTGQEWTVFTRDQQLYKVVVNILWREPVLFPKQCSEQYDLSLLLVKCVADLGIFHLVVSEEFDCIPS